MGFKDDFDSGAGPKDDYLKLKEGANVIRVLDEPEVIVSRFDGGKFVGVCFEGAPYCTDLSEGERLNKKWKTWVIDRTDGKVKLYDMPYTIAKELRGYMDDPNYKFTAWPMPFDVTINAKGAGTKEVEYSVRAARQDTALTAAEQADFAGRTKVAEIVQKAKDNAKKAWEDKHSIQLDEPEVGGHVEAPTTRATRGAPNPDDIPF